ncbi:MAG TPA: response regulator, partial [Chitinophaga sp.]
MNTGLRIVIVEDEPVIVRDLAFLLHRVDGSLRLMQTLASVQEAVAWFNAHEGSYDLVFMDIRLSDGQSFDIFRQVNMIAPVIFVTAYHDHALTAFKHNGLDYILKPFDETDLRQALEKYC